MHRFIRRSLLSLALSTTVVTPLFAAEPAACKNVRLGVVNWTD
ncbi:glycine/betaine ABC transporter substrate-binding protein, partial [Pseudomonas sp. MH2]|nr:glycine/betaine ABC transporter substrate-binding protein [Pseudomonas sp. MH2]